MIRLAVFDLDGTIADTSEGIINSHRYAHEKMGREVPSKDILARQIGNELLKVYMDFLCFSREDAIQAIKYYRDYYAKHGINEAIMYDGIPQMFRELKQAGCHLAVATLKAERFAKHMMKNLGISEMLDVVCGMNETDDRTKAEMIQYCMSSVNCKPEETVMVGDSEQDLAAANAAHVGFVGVNYGFGFIKQDDYCNDAGSITKRIKQWGT